jgi:hypothetical protein
MSDIGLHRGVAGSGTGLGVGQWVQGNTTNGRQDKSADLGRAHVVGFVEFLVHCQMTTCWRVFRIFQRFQRSERRRTPSEKACCP